MRSLNALDESAITIKVRIAILWTSATLLYLYGDVIGFYVPGSLHRIIDGKLGEWTVTPTWLLAVAVLMSTPALMGALTVVLKPVVSRWLNVVMGAAYSALILFTMIDAWKFGFHFYIYLGVVEVLVTVFIVWYALRWPRQPLETTALPAAAPLAPYAIRRRDAPLLVRRAEGHDHREPMKAIAYSEFGGPEILRLVDVRLPVPKDNEILIRVRAAALNPADWHLARGIPFPLRMMQGGMRKPASARRLGLEVAGTVEAAGRSVSEWTAGDCVFGGCEGSVAEYVTVAADRVVRKPERLTFEQVAGVSIAGLTALQALRDKAQVQRGQKVLINGAAGGIGTFAVQIAKMFGAEVTGVQSTRNLDLIRSLGADHVIDYTRQDFTQSAERYDVIFDNVVNRPLSDLLRVLKPGGTLIPNGGGSTPAQAMRISRILRTLMLRPFISQRIRFFVTKPNRGDLQMLADLMQAGAISQVIDTCYPFNRTSEAMRHLETGHARGKIVVTVGQPGV